jgi:predicted ester cyclase
VADERESNKEIVRRLIDEGFNDGRLDVVDEVVSPDLVTHNPLILDAPSGPDSIRGGIEMLRKSFSDIDVELIDILAEDDRVATFMTMSGKNTGDYRRGGATGKRASLRAFFIWRLANGKIVENWGCADRFEFLQQLGMIPSDDEIARGMPAPEGST